MRTALAFLGLLSLSACTADLPESDAMFRVSDDSGSITVALVGTDATGQTYRLRKATFEVSGSAMFTLHGRDGRDLSAPLPEGDYQMYLRPGYELVARAADGSERPVEARLSSPNPARLHVTSRNDGTVGLSFSSAQGDIAFGQTRGLRAAAGGPPAVVAARAVTTAP